MDLTMGVWLLFVGVCSGTCIAAICPPDWHQYGKSCYLMETQPMTWHEADSACRKRDGNLAVPNSQTEQTFIVELRERVFNGEPTRVWIGCNDIEEEGNWQNCKRNEYNNNVGSAGRPF